MKVEITVPEGWEDIKLSQYIQYMKAIKPYEKAEDFELIRLEKAINHFCNVDTETIRTLPIENYDGIIHYMQELFLNTDNRKLAKTFDILDTTYGFVPNLDNITFGEYLDLTTYSKDLWSNLPTFLSIVYRPITKSDGKGYEIEPYSGTDEHTINLFTNALTMNIVWGAIGFFSFLHRDLVNGMVTYSIQNLKEMTINSQVVETLIKNGVDISLYQSLLETTSRDSKRLRN